MEFLTWYFLFALTTAFAAVYELFWPVIKEITITHSESMISNNPKMSLFVSFVIALLIAPILLPSCLIPSAGHKFRDAFKRKLISD